STMKNFVLLFTIWVCWSCHSGDSGDLIVQSEETTDFEVVVDTIRVPTPGTTREFPYYCVSRDYRGTHFAGLDMRTGKINIMDLETFSLTDTITLHPTGPNGIEIFQIGAIYYHNSDSIFILQH